MNQVGREIPRLEVRAKVTGRADYTHHLRLPGMLYGKVFRSTVPHGRIRGIDIQAARELPGVYRVVTGEDIKTVVADPYYGPAFHDQPILALDKVRHVGEPVAVVLAGDPHVAEQAVQMISADYEELPAVYDEVAAMQPDALVHDVLKPPALSPISSISKAAAAPMSRSIIICAAATSIKPSPRPRTYSSTLSRPSSACISRWNRSFRWPSRATTG